MKNSKILSFLTLLATASLAHATIYSSTGLPSTTGAIPDGNPVGLSSTYNLNTFGDANTINGVSVTLDISGGFNGDLYGYLVNPNGNMAILLNRVGTGSGGAIQSAYGFADAGMFVILSDAGMPAGSLAGGIHTYGAGDITSGTTAWSPDNGTADFSALHTGGANGNWTLFLADLNSGDQSTLVSWSLNVSVVPEPVTWALLLFAGLLSLVALGKWTRRQTS